MVIEPSLERVREARELLHGHFGATRVVEAQFLARRTGKRLRLKLETQLRTGSFRVRGAVWALAARLKRESVAGVVASGTGNHGAAVAWTGWSQLLISPTIGKVKF